PHRAESRALSRSHETFLVAAIRNTERRFFLTREICEAKHAHEIIPMSFVETLDSLALRKSELIERFEHLIASKSDHELEAIAQSSRMLTMQNFGRTMRLFAPLYLSNECINNCQYCGFSRDNPILRVTLS